MPRPSARICRDWAFCPNSGSGSGHVQAAPCDLAKIVDRLQHALFFHVPERPAIAGFQPLDASTEPMDRPCILANRDCAVGAHMGGPALLAIIKPHAGLHE